MTDSLRKQIFRLAFPVALQSVLVSLLGMSDVFMVAGLGAGAVAAIGLGAKLHFVLIMVMASLGTAVSILVAQHHGRGNSLASQAILLLGQASGLLLLLPIAVAFFVFPAALLAVLSDDGEMIQMGTAYLRLTVPLLLLTHIIICYEGALRARSETVAPLLMAAIAIVINILFNYLLIHGVGPFPKLGVAGVAIASDLARLIQVLLLLLYLHWRQHSYAVGRLLGTWRIALTQSRAFLAAAWPLTLNFTVWGMGTFVYHGIAARRGTEALASLSLISPIEGLYHAFFFGLVSACAILVGQHLGRDDFDTAKLLAKRFAVFAPLGSMLVGLLILAASPVFLPWLLDPEDSLYRLCMQLMWVMCLSFWIKVLNMTLIVGVLRAGGDAKFVLGTDLVSMWLLAIPAALTAAFVFNLPYVWVYAMVLVEEIVKCGLIIHRAQQGFWLKNLTRNAESAGGLVSTTR